MTEDKVKKIVGKAYERWIARIRDVGIQDDALNLSCLDRFHDFFPLLSIRRTDELLGKDKDFDAWYPIRDDVEEKILAVGLCSFDAGFDVPQEDDALNFNISCDIKISKNAVDEMLAIIMPLVADSQGNVKRFHDVQRNLDRHAKINHEDCGF